MIRSSTEDISVVVCKERAKMALNRSSELNGVIVHILCVVEIQFESAWAIINVTGEPLAMLNGPQMHLSQVAFKKKNFPYFPIFLWFKRRTPGEDLIWTLGSFSEQTWFRITRQCFIPFQTAEPSSSGEENL